MKKKLSCLHVIVLLACVFQSIFSYGQNSASKLKIEKMGERYIYTLGDMCSVFPKSYVSATPFSYDNLAIVSDSLYYVINLKGERVSPFFQEIERHKSGLYIGKESDESGFAIYDVGFKKMTKHPFDTIASYRDNLFKCISRTHLTLITTTGFFLADFDTPYLWSDFECYAPCLFMSYKEYRKLDLIDSIYNYTIIQIIDKHGGFTTGYCDYQGNLLVSCKDHKKSSKELRKFKKTLIPIYRKFWEEKKHAFDNCENVLAENISKATELYPAKFETPVLASIATQKQVKNKRGKVTKKAGKYFINSKTKEKQSELFKNITSIGGKYYLVKNYQDKFALANSYGHLMTDFIYDDFSLWSNASNPIYRYSIKGKYGLKRVPTGGVLACEFDKIGNITNQFAIATQKVNGSTKYFIVNKEGEFVTTYTYDNVIKDKKGTYRAYLGEGDDALIAILDPVTGKEKSPTMQEQFFYRVVDEEKEPKEMIEAYDLVIQMGGPVTAAAYNNKGVAYKNLNDRTKARECYEKAKSLGNEKAIENLKSLDDLEAAEAEERRLLAEKARQEKARKREQTLNEVVDLIGAWASLLGGDSSSSSGNSSYSSSYSESSYSSSSSSSSNKVRAKDKCHICLGSGECMTIHAGSKSACGGSGRCGTCLGDGIIHVAGAGDTLCPNCDRNHNGKCKRCHGTGKCPVCHGTGLKQ